MKKIYIKAIGVAFVCNTVLSLSLPLTTYANSELNNQEMVDQNEKNTLNEDMSISISPETLEETNRENDEIVEEVNVKEGIIDENDTSNPTTELQDTAVDNVIEPIEDNSLSNLSEDEITEIESLEKNSTILSDVEENEQRALVSKDVTISTYVESRGWLAPVEHGEIAGTTNQGLKLESFKIASTHPDLSIQYRSFSKNLDNWFSWMQDNKESNPINSSDQIEAIQLKLDGPLASKYDIYYRVHSRAFGWLGWAKNGEASGTRGYDYRIEAIEVKVVPIEEESPKQTDTAYVEKIIPTLTSSAHVQSFGWMNADNNTAIIGVTGQRKRLEAIRLSLDTGNMQGGIEYRSLVQDDGWQGWKREGQLSGTEGQQKRLEAIEIRLYGEIARYFDVTYQSHVESYGWLGTVVTGMPSGTENMSKRMEALQIDIVEKGSVQVNPDDGYRRAPKVETSTHVQSYGWLKPQGNGSVVGTIGQRKRLEAIRLSLDAGNLQGGIEYRSLVQGEGWQGWKRDSQLSGTEGQEKRLEAIEIRLYGEVAEHYDVTYQSHVESYGWLGTVVTGMASGTQMLSKRMEALKIDIVEKGSLKVNPDNGFKRAPIVFIDSGHGGEDPGASYFGVEEAWLNLSTGNRVINSLREKGFDVRASRETDVGLELKERAALANEIQPDVFFSIHYNAMGGNNIYARGIESFIYHRVASGFGQETNRDNFETEDPRIEKSLRLADLIHKNVINDTKFYDRGVKGNNFHVLRETTIPAALIELGFVDNRQDSEIIKKESYHQKAADAIVKGIVAFFGNWK